MNGPTNIAAFQEIIADAAYIHVDPLSCVPLSKIISTSRAVVLRFALLFSRVGTDKLGPTAKGISCGSSTTVVVRLFGEDLSHKEFHLKLKGYRGSAIQEKA